MRPAQPLVDVRLTDAPVRVEPIVPFPFEAGGECVFLGRTRRDSHPRHGELQRLHYEAYREMAVTVLRDLAEQAIERFGCVAVRVHHALGEVPLGEASVLVQVACGHRDKAFEACRFLIDRLKSDAPIWKREQWERGETWSEAVNLPSAQENVSRGRP
jgi:molybdopterin synthase catalytic subunit